MKNMLRCITAATEFGIETCGWISDADVAEGDEVVIEAPCGNYNGRVLEVFDMPTHIARNYESAHEMR